MKINIDYSSDLPMYEQLKNCIKENILNGSLEKDEALPSVRQMAKELNVSTITIKRAYMELEREGFIYTVAGKGTFVRDVDLSKILTEKREKMLEEYEEKIREMKRIGIEKEILDEIIERIYMEE
ncbi:MAG: GntR family transcriptional regulator [Clostridiales bacterium]|nr:GntR family transcriptional regulator [Clostridiales bacterium]